MGGAWPTDDVEMEYLSKTIMEENRQTTDNRSKHGASEFAGECENTIIPL